MWRIGATKAAALTRGSLARFFRPDVSRGHSTLAAARERTKQHTRRDAPWLPTPRRPQPIPRHTGTGLERIGQNLKVSSQSRAEWVHHCRRIVSHTIIPRHLYN